MKKFSLFLVLLFGLSIQADAGFIIQKFASGGASGDSCTSGLLAAIHFEAADVTTGTPGGCYILHDTDTTLAFGSGGTLNNDTYSDGSNSLDAPSQYDKAELPINQNYPSTEGTVEVDLYIGTCALAEWFVEMPYDAGGVNRFDIKPSASCSNGAIDITMSIITSAGTNGAISCNLNGSTGQWYRIKGEWKNQAGNDLKITIWTLDASSPREIAAQQCTTTEDDDWNTMANTPNALQVGAANNNTPVDYHVDRLYIRSDSTL
jgi:hypothetical protein